MLQSHTLRGKVYFALKCATNQSTAKVFDIHESGCLGQPFWWYLWWWKTVHRRIARMKCLTVRTRVVFSLRLSLLCIPCVVHFDHKLNMKWSNNNRKSTNDNTGVSFLLCNCMVEEQSEIFYCNLMNTSVSIYYFLCYYI